MTIKLQKSKKKVTSLRVGRDVWKEFKKLSKELGLTEHEMLELLIKEFENG